MRVTAKICAASGLLFVGLLLALLFRRDPAETGPSGEPDPLLILRGDRGHVPRRRHPSSNEEPPGNLAAGEVTPGIVPPAQSVLPELPPEYQPWLADHNEGSVKEATEAGLGRQRTHRVIDGDTLAGLAQRYLGDRARQEEIARANADRLTTPEVLPIGLLLRIPPRSPVSAEAAPSRQSESASPAPSVLPPLVPIPRRSVGSP